MGNKRIKVAELERRGEDYDQALLHSDHELLPLLRLARAAKARHEQWTRETYVAVADALAAFDFG